MANRNPRNEIHVQSQGIPRDLHPKAIDSHKMMDLEYPGNQCPRNTLHQTNRTRNPWNRRQIHHQSLQSLYFPSGPPELSLCSHHPDLDSS